MLVVFANAKNPTISWHDMLAGPTAKKEKLGRVLTMSFLNKRELKHTTNENCYVMVGK
jgi:hypothetical protein